MTDRQRYMLIYVLFAVTVLIIMSRQDITAPVHRPLSLFPIQLESWKISQQTEFDGKTLEILKATDYLSRQYIDLDGKPVNIYIGYHDGTNNSNGIHTPKNCLPGSGWLKISTQRVVLDSGERRLNIVRAVYQKGEDKELFLYWFQVRQFTTANEYVLKLAKVFNTALHKRRDESFIRVSVPVDNTIEQSLARGEQFVRDLNPVLKEHLPQ